MYGLGNPVPSYPCKHAHFIAFCSILKFVFTAMSLNILSCVRMHTFIHTYLYPWIFMQAKILLFCLYVSSLTKTTNPSHQSFLFILVVSHADHLFKLLYSSIWEIFSPVGCIGKYQNQCCEYYLHWFLAVGKD